MREKKLPANSLPPDTPYFLQGPEKHTDLDYIKMHVGFYVKYCSLPYFK